jgi:hypothetical protein
MVGVAIRGMSMAVFERAVWQHFAPNPFSKQGRRIERMVDRNCHAGTSALISRAD